MTTSNIILSVECEPILAGTVLCVECAGLYSFVGGIIGAYSGAVTGTLLDVFWEETVHYKWMIFILWHLSSNIFVSQNELQNIYSQTISLEMTASLFGHFFPHWWIPFPCTAIFWFYNPFFKKLWSWGIRAL